MPALGIAYIAAECAPGALHELRQRQRSAKGALARVLLHEHVAKRIARAQLLLERSSGPAMHARMHACVRPRGGGLSLAIHIWRACGGCMAVGQPACPPHASSSAA